MKKILFGRKQSGVPFWQPWGFGGCIGRLLLFLALLLLLLMLLSLFHRCGGSDIRDLSDADDVASTWRRPITDAERYGLPTPEENSLPDFGNMDPVPYPDEDGIVQIYPNLLYIIFDSESNDETFKVFAKDFGALYPAPAHTIDYYNTGSKTAIINVPEDKRDQICQELPSKITDVKFYVTPVEVMTSISAVTPNDPAFKDSQKSWYFSPIQAQEAWGLTQGSSDIVVGIVDSYFDLSHPELKGDRSVKPYNVLDGSTDVAPKSGVQQEFAGHGTFVASVAVGNVNNNEGSSGIAPKCKFIPVSMGVEMNTITLVEGLLYCMYNGANVINISSGMYFPEEVSRMPIEEQIAFAEQYGKPQEEMWDYVFDLAEKRNVTIVWAAGNSNCYDEMDTSKRGDNTIRVSAVDKNLKKADFSNFGNIPERHINASTISAPGVDIWGAVPGGKYETYPGTSFSAPIIAGTVALMKSKNKNLTNKQIIQILQATGKPAKNSPSIGKIVQIRDAVVQAAHTSAGS